MSGLMDSASGAMGLMGAIDNYSKAKRDRKRAEKKRQMAAKLAADAKRKRTANATTQRTEVAQRNRQRDAAIMSRGFTPPTLGKPGLLGVNR